MPGGEPRSSAVRGSGWKVASAAAKRAVLAEAAFAAG
jgi:hypothetical protein